MSAKRKAFFWYYDVLLTDRSGDVSTLVASDGIGRGTWSRSLAKAKEVARGQVGKSGVVKAEIIRRSSTSVATFTAKTVKSSKKKEG